MRFKCDPNESKLKEKSLNQQFGETFGTSHMNQTDDLVATNIDERESTVYALRWIVRYIVRARLVDMNDN